MTELNAIEVHTAPLEAEVRRLKAEVAALIEAWPDDCLSTVTRVKRGWNAYPSSGVVRTFPSKAEAVRFLVRGEVAGA